VSSMRGVQDSLAGNENVKTNRHAGQRKYGVRAACA
jgi:hypothetical protein